MTNTRKAKRTNHSKIDIHELLTRRRQVAIIWSIEDVQEVRPDLSDAQSWEVLQECIHAHDCEHGFTWDFIRYVAQELFPSDNDAEEE